MGKGRLEAFSGGVIAIIITIIVLEFKVPHREQLSDLLPLWPVFLSYVLSFANVGIYWNNHHHLMQPVKKVNGAVLWANLNLLFWFSLMPFATAWMGENQFASMPMVVYCLDLCMCAIGYTVLQSKIIKLEGAQSALQQPVGRDLKGKVSLASYVLAIPLAFSVCPGYQGCSWEQWRVFGSFLIVELKINLRRKQCEPWLFDKCSKGP